MKAKWTIYHRGVSRTFETAKVTGCVLSRQLTGEESCALPFAPGAPEFLADEVVTVLRNGRSWFTGRATDPAASMSGKSEGSSITLKGPSCEFSERSFITRWADRVNGGEADVSRGFVGVDGTGNRVEVGAALLYLAETVRTLAMRQYQGVAPFTVGNINVPVAGPIQKVSDATWEDALRKVTEFVPDCVVSWDHSTIPPTLNIARARDLSVVQMTLGETSRGGLRGSVESFNAGINGAAPRGVVVVFRRQVEEDGELGKKIFHTEYRSSRYPADVEAGWRNVLTFTVDVSQDDEESWEVPADLSRYFFEHLRSSPWSGSLTWHGEECLDELTPGRVLNVLGSDTPGHATMRAVIYSATHDVFAGRSTVEFGRPDTLGFDDFRAITAWMRRRKLATDADQHHLDEQATGETEDESYGFAGDEDKPRKIGFAKKEISFCDSANGPMTGTFLVKDLRIGV